MLKSHFPWVHQTVFFLFYSFFNNQFFFNQVEFSSSTCCQSNMPFVISASRSLFRESECFCFCLLFFPPKFVQNTPKQRQVSGLRKFVKISYDISPPLSSLSSREESCRDGVIDCAAWWAIISRYGHMHGESPQYSVLPLPLCPW